MKNVLIINSSINSQSSVSTQLTSFFVQQLSAKESFKIISRDVGANPPAHLDEDIFSAFIGASEADTKEQKEAVNLSNELIAEFQLADIVIVGAPMYNFSIPSGLKSYFDYILRNGITFKYTENGPIGLLENKKVFIITATGGNYSLDYMQPLDFLSPYLKQLFSFMGLNDLHTIATPGIALGEDVAAESIAASKQEIVEISKELN